MADTTTQIYNQTIYWADFVANSLTLFTTDAVTRYVIKDMEVADNTFPSSFALVVNDTRVASLNGSLTGTEILDVNSTVRLTYDTSTAAYISVNCLSNSASAFSNNVTAGAVFFTPTGFLSGSATASTPVAMSQLTTPSNVQGGWLLNGNFYYHITDQNSTQALYRRAGGITGTQSTIYSDSYSPCCFDGVSKFYWINSSGYIYNYDTATGTSTYLGSFSGGTTYPMLCYVAGYLFYSRSYTSVNTLNWYRISNGATGSFGTGGATPYSSNTGPTCFYNASNGTIKICLGNYNSYSSGYSSYTLSIASGTPVYVSQASSNSTTKNFRYNTMTSTGGNYAIMLGSSTDNSYNTIYLIDDSMSVISQKTITGDYFGGPTESGSYQIISPTALVKEATSPTVRLRVTGVKTV